jgi:hypothetical protein
MGVIAGPIVGGYLSFPAQKYPEWFPKGSLFDRHPFALPCIIGTAIVAAGLCIGYFVLEETNQKVINCPVDFNNFFFNKSSRSEEEEMLLPQENPSDDSTNVESNRITTRELLAKNKVWTSLVCYGAVSFIYIQFDELFAVWSRLPAEKGGLGFDSSDQGTAYSLGGSLLFLYQLFAFPYIEKRFGILKTFQSGVLASIPIFIIMPLIGEFAAYRDGRFEFWVWFWVTLINMIRNLAGVQAFTATFLMIANSCPSDYRGTINGIGQSVGSLGR